MNIAHAYKTTNTNSSKRTVVHKKGMEENFGNISNGNHYKNKHKTTKLNNLDQITIENDYIINVEHDTIQKKMKTNCNSSTKNYYYTFHDKNDTNKNELNQLFLDSNNNMIDFYTSGMDVVDTYDGAITSDNDYPLFILVQRDDALLHQSNGRADYDCLEWLMDHHNNLNIRGNEKSGFSKKYVTVGAHGSHFKKGLHIKKLKGKRVEFHEPYLKKWFGRIQKLASEYLPFGLLSSLMISKFIVDDNISYHYKTGIQGEDELNKSIWASMASSYNYISPSHTDNDAFLSCLTITLYPSNEPRNGRYRYPKKCEICCYFCFPGVNKAIALRPGDVLFFNPLQKHCISQRTINYLDEKLYCSSFYITTKQISGNDNTKPFEVNERINRLGK